jgi:enoyl-CoA hydratase
MAHDTLPTDDAMSFDTLLFDVDDAGIATITINRPDKLNALNQDVMNDLEAAFTKVHSDNSIRGVILTGQGEKSFVAGADIRQFTKLDADSGRTFAERGQAVFNLIEQSPKPVIAAVNGYALGGGCELALACHIRIASENAIFGQPEVNLGIIPGYGGTQRLPRVVGRGIAIEMILTGDQVKAQRAYEVGLANRVVASESLLDEARAMMKTITSKAPLAVGMSLDAILASEKPMKDGLSDEADLFGKACATDDFSEGAAAFLERRKPSFHGR